MQGFCCRRGLLAIFLVCAQISIDKAGAEDARGNLPLPDVIVQIKALLAKVEATPFLPLNARRQAQEYYQSLDEQFLRLRAPIEEAYSQRQRDLAAWQKKKSTLSQRNSIHTAKPHQFKPSEAQASAAYDTEAEEIRADIVSLNQELERMDLAWQEHYATLSKPLEDWLQQPALAAFIKTLQSLLDGRTTFQPGAVDPRKMITLAQYQSAKRDLSRLETQQQKIGAQLEKVRGWKNGLDKDVDEFEAMRRDAQRDLVLEFLDHVPVSEGLMRCEQTGVLTSRSVAKIEAGYGAVKGLINEGKGISAKETPEQFQKIVEGNLELTKAMQAIPRETLTNEQKKWLDGFAKVYSASVKVITGTLKEQSDFESIGKVCIEVGEVIVPAAGLPVLAEHLGERYAKHWSASQALVSLGQARSSNWDAERSLTSKLNELNASHIEVKREIDGYERLLNENRTRTEKSPGGRREQ